MSDKDDLRELRELTKDNETDEVPQPDTNTYETPNPTVNPYDYDDEEGILKENARLWAKVGDAFFPADQTVNKLSGQYSIEFSHNQKLLLHLSLSTLMNY